MLSLYGLLYELTYVQTIAAMQCENKAAENCHFLTLTCLQILMMIASLHNVIRVLTYSSTYCTM